MPSASISSSRSSSSDLSDLKALLGRPSPFDLSEEDLQLVLPHLGGTDERHSVALAVLSRSTSSGSSPSPATSRSIQASLESLLSGTNSTELVQGLNLLSSLVQVSPTFVVSSLFPPSPSPSTSSTLSALLRDVVDHISSPLQQVGRGDKGRRKEDEERVALVELLSLASGQPQLRQLVRDSAGEWLENIVDRGSRRVRASAGVGVVKLRLAGKEKTTSVPSTAPERPPKWTLEQLASIFVDLALQAGTTEEEEEEEKADSERTLLATLEGLAYLTLTPSRDIKRIASRPDFLSLLFSFGSTDKQPLNRSNSAARNYAIATLLRHLTSFPNLEDAASEAAQVERLKNFASARGGGGRANALDKQETAEEVTARVSSIVQQSPSPIPLVRQLCLSPSLETRRLAGSILHSLVTPPSLRGRLLQQGVSRLVLTLIRHIPTPFDVTRDLAPVQALSKLLITANPLLVFGPTPSSPVLLEATTALTLPFNQLSSTPLLATFESLMALTNVASLDPELTDKIARLELRDKQPPSTLLDTLEELLLSQNSMVTRAATELVCNLVASEPGIKYFEPSSSSSSPSSSSSSTSASSRLHLIVALSSSEDLPTRLAASGALTSLVFSSSISTTLATVPRYLELLIGLLDDGESGVRHRGYEVWRGIGEALSAIEEQENDDRERKKRAIEGLKAKGILRKLGAAREREKVEELRESVSGAEQVIRFLVASIA